ncbi:MAG: D-2-hydroxyacid dehydrogenase, partial [Chloroflexota bacterium]
MKIVVLDGYALNPGDLSWQGFRETGDLVVYDRTPAELVYERSSGAGIILTNKTILTGEMLRKLPDLKYVGVL